MPSIRRSLTGFAVSSAVLLSSGAHAAQRTIWTISSGASYSSGDYGDVSATRVFAIPFSLTYHRGGLKLRASLPWVRISGPGSLIQTPEGRDAGGGGTTTGNSNSGGGGPGPSGGGGIRALIN